LLRLAHPLNSMTPANTRVARVNVVERVGTADAGWIMRRSGKLPKA